MPLSILANTNFTNVSFCRFRNQKLLQVIMSKLPVFEKTDHPKGGKTYLDDVLPLVVTTLSRQLIPDDSWKQWANVIKDYDDKPKYRMAEIR